MAVGGGGGERTWEDLDKNQRSWVDFLSALYLFVGFLSTKFVFLHFAFKLQPVKYFLIVLLIVL